MPRYVSDLPIADLARSTRLLGEKELELTSRGYHPRLVEAGMARAWGMADFHTRALSPGLRGPAFVEWLRYELIGVATWIDQDVAGNAK